jgi:hypothetical protein
MAPLSLVKLIQPGYNPRGPYLPIFKNSQLHKYLFKKRIGDGKKIANVFNALVEKWKGWQLSQAARY